MAKKSVKSKGASRESRCWAFVAYLLGIVGFVIVLLLKKKDQFAWLRKYYPYHNVKKGTQYPAVLLTAGENDSRVHPLHARKMAALLQASTSARPTDRPVLLWVDRDAGHGQGKPLALRIRDVADQRCFLMWQLGMLKGEPAKATGGELRG